MSTQLQPCITGERLDVYFHDVLGLCLPSQLSIFQAMFGHILTGNSKKIESDLKNLCAQERSVHLNKLSESLFPTSHARLFLSMYNSMPVDRERAKVLVRYVRQMFNPVVKSALIHASHILPSDLLVTWTGPFNPNTLKQRDDHYNFCPFKDKDVHPLPVLPFFYLEYYVWVKREGVTTPEGQVAIDITEENIVELNRLHKPITNLMLDDYISMQNVAQDITEGKDEESAQFTNFDSITDLPTAKLIVKLLQNRVKALTAENLNLKRELEETAKATSAPTKPLAEVAQKPGDKPAGMDKPVGVDLESLAVESCDIEDVANMLVENELFPEKSGHRMEDKHSVICSFCKTAIKPSQKYVKCQYGKNHLGKTYSYLHYDTKSRKRCAVFESPGETAAPIVTKRLQEFFSIPHTCKTCWDANGVGSIYSDLRGLNEL